MPHGGHRLRRRQETADRDHGGEAAPHPREARRDRRQSRVRLGRAARREPQGARAGRGDAGAGARGDEDRLPRVPMSDQDNQSDVVSLKSEGDAPPTPDHLLPTEEEESTAYKVTLP